ncbi:MAG: lipoate--protein ligase family protein [Chloroflexi bacterium]|nr:lipoate--protein ligase family protein [Chloroflexota bacterium]MCI0648414.1 lipoate--protein ligase family protein [Chloroflexota bacterium]MCI0727650.1 lipoate--protein ligase family protein [Chloroflexota bacterium]
MLGRRPVKRESYEPATWRFLATSLGDGPTHMAVDEAILEAVAAGDSPPTLRFYGWQPACLSLGYEQEWDLADLDRCQELGWDVVRRPTGGRAILHGDELTYSLCTLLDDPRVRGELHDSYEKLSAGLVRGLNLLGLEPARARPYYEDRGLPGPAAFDGPYAEEHAITLGQRRLMTSVQLRRDGAVLQQGSLPLVGDITRIAEAFYFDLPGQRTAMVNRLGYRATTLELVLARVVSFEEAAGSLRQGFAEALNLALEPGQLSEREKARAETLRAEKYINLAWTRRV